MATVNQKNDYNKQAVETRLQADSLKTAEAHVGTADSASDDADPAVARMTLAKWLACIALGTCFTTAFQQNVCTSAIVKHIDNALGPTNYYNWILSGYSIAVSVSLPLSGGLSDIFGRKWFFIGGCTISLIGTIIALAAQNVPMVVAGMVLKGIGSGSQQLAFAAIGEIVPNKYRGNAQAMLDLVTLPWSVFGALMGNAMVKYSKLSFRINFIVGVVLNVLSIIFVYFWYHPPKAQMLPGVSRMQSLLKLDWIGVFLMAIGIVLTLMGLAFGGVQFGWSSAGVVAPLTIGLVSLVLLGIWEWKIARNPFFAHELFVGKTRTFTLLLVLTFISGMAFYTAAAFWTQQCMAMFTRDPIKIGLSAIPGGFGGAVGGVLGGVAIGKGRGLGSNHILIYGSIIKLIADAVFITIKPNTFSLALGMGFLAMFGMGFLMVALIVCVQLASEDRHIGLATLVLGSIRAIGGSVAVTIYTSIMQNTIKEDAGPRVGAAVVPMGFPRATMPQLIPLLLNGRTADAAKLNGMTPQILSVATETVKWSWALAFKRIYYAAVSVAAVSVITSFFVKDVSHNMTNSVAVVLKNDVSVPVGEETRTKKVVE